MRAAGYINYSKTDEYVKQFFLYVVDLCWIHS